MSDLVQEYVDLLYASTIPRVRVQRLSAFIMASCIFWALCWLLYRAYQVCQTPNEVLVDKLGLDIPPSPDISLEDIQPREFRITWKLPDTHHSVTKYMVQVNGNFVGEVKRSETAAVIYHLTPNTIYSVRVQAVSAADFHTPSPTLHVCTKDLALAQGTRLDNDGQITVRPYIPSPDNYAPAPAPVMTREHSGSQSGGKRPGPHRKHSPAVVGNGIDGAAEDSARLGVKDESDEPLEQLADRLKALQAENDAVEKQLLQEEEEFLQMTAELEQARDEAKNRVKERNEASGDLRKQVNALENNNRTAQNEKNKKERLLHQKGSEFKKRRDDISRWEKQVEAMREEMTRIKKKKAQAQDDSAQRAQEIDDKILEQQLENKTVEEDLRVNGLKLKKLEEERQELVGGDEGDEAREAERLEKEKDKEWELKMNSLRTRYASMMGAFNQAQTQYHEAQERLKWLNARQSNAPGSQVTMPSLELDFSRKGSKRRTRHRNSLQSNVSSPAAGYAVLDNTYQHPTNYSSGQGVSPTFAASTALFNINNGMAIPGPSEQTDASVDSYLPSVITPMSPRADALLPSDLLGDEELMPYHDNTVRAPTSPVHFSGLGSAAIASDMPGRDGSPVSSGSRSASIFSSPRESLNNLPMSNFQDSDRHSLHRQRTEESEGAQSASRRLSGFFNFSRQRGKTMADGPPLGSLKQGQSQSFPRNLDEDIGPSALGARRRRLSYTGNWPNMGNLFPRSTTTPADQSSNGVTPARRTGLQHLFNNNRSNPSGFTLAERNSSDTTDAKPGYNQFSPRHDPIDPSILLAPRGENSPKLLGFSDNHLPKPSDNSPFGWNAEDTTIRPSPFGMDWASPQAWSRNHSRRPSVQYGSATNLSLVPSGESNFYDPPHDSSRPLQAPIGTRPTSSQRPVTPKLNPAAPSFRAVFSRKSEPQDKGKSPEHRFEEDGLSPPRRSISNSVTESHDSLELISSGTPSDGTSARETFIQRITRKGSSSQFKIPWKDRPLFSKKGEGSPVSSAPAEGDEENLFAAADSQLGKSIGSLSSLSMDKSSKPSSLSFSFMRKARKAEKGGTSVGEPSEKGGETGDEDTFEEV